MLALNNEDEEVAKGILDLAKLMRYSLTSSQTSTLEKELNQIKRYLNLQKLRLSDRLEWTINVEDEELLNLTCPQFLLQPIVENSIKHGIEKVRRGGSIVINVHKTGKEIIISVTDSGAGIVKERMENIRKLLSESSSNHNPLQMEDKGYALYNVCMRMKLFYGNGFSLEIGNNEPAGTVCMMHLSQIAEDIGVDNQ